MDKDFVHINIGGHDIRLAILPDDDYSDNYARLADTIMHALAAINFRDGFENYFPELSTLTVKFYKTEVAKMDSKDAPVGMNWHYATPVPMEEALRPGIYYRIEKIREPQNED